MIFDVGETVTGSSLRERYRAAFAAYLSAPSEAALEPAFALGREAVAEGLSPLDLAQVHHEALAAVIRFGEADHAAEFLRHALSTFEIERLGFDEAKERAGLEHAYAERMRALVDASMGIAATLDEREIVKRLAHDARALLRARGARAEIEYGEPPDVATGVSGHTNSAAASETLVVPLRGRGGRPAGSLVLDGLPAAPTTLDAAICDQLAHVASVALANAATYRRERGIAQTLQRSLLPPTLPEIAGVDLAARFIPAGEGIEVGGDFYDVFAGPDGWWTIAVGDVCGKGPEAASITALARYTIRAVQALPGCPSAVLARLNDALVQQHPDRRFCTVVLAHLAVEPGPGVSVTLSSGGHPPPVVVRADGTVEEADVHGMLMGVVDNPRLQDRKLTLSPGDALLLYTDGVTEVRRDGREVFGEADLRAAAAAAGGGGAEALVDTVVQAALDAARGDPRDDIAVLALAVPEL
jgi:serine phosphatase RsbU (regulator of sigma subunit)